MDDNLQPSEACTAAVSDEQIGPGKETIGSAPGSLRDRSMDSLLHSILSQSSDNLALIDEAEILSDFTPSLRCKIYNQAAELKPSASLLSLLRRVLEKDEILDLSPFKNFTVRDLSVIFAGLRDGVLRTLNLSNMMDLTNSDLGQILSGGPALSEKSTAASPPEVTLQLDTGNLRRIILLETPKITLGFLAQNVGHCDIDHTGLLLRPLLRYRYDEQLPMLKFRSPNTVSQLVWVGIPRVQACKKELRLENGQMDWSGLKYSNKGASPFGGNTSLNFKTLLIDVPLPAGKTVRSLQRLMRYMTSPELNWSNEWSKAAARCFATTSIIDDESSHSIGPLSMSLKGEDGAYYDKKGKKSLLGPGEWAIILVQEAFDADSQDELDEAQLKIVNRSDPRRTEGLKEQPEEKQDPTYKPLKRLRYMLAKALPEGASSTEQFLVTDVSGYTQHFTAENEGKAPEMTSLNGWWENKSSKFIDRFGYYGDDDTQELLQKIYSQDDSNQAASPQSRVSDPRKMIMEMMTMAEREEHGRIG